MDVESLLSKAWAAVQKSGVPPEMHEAAFKEAIAYLRGAHTQGTPDVPGKAGSGSAKKRGSTAKSAARRPTPAEADDDELHVDEDQFFDKLSKESGVPEQDLRDILHVTDNGRVEVTTPTRELGASVSEQAKTVIALVAAARSKGLGEKPVSADAVRKEVDRKHCYQQNNFSSGHLGPLKGFNGGSKGEIHLTSKWVGEFKAAIDKAHGRKPDAE